MSALKKLAGSRWFILAVLFLVLNGYAVYLYSHNTERHSPEDVTVTLISPKNGQVTSQSKAILKWRFSANMVSGFGIGKWFDTGPVDFSPQVAGSFCWSQANELIFRPENGWCGCTEFTATFSEDLRSLDSRPLVGPRVFPLRSDSLILYRVSQTEFSNRREAQLNLEFSDKISPAQLESHLKIRTPTGTDIPYKINRREDQKAIGITLQQLATNAIVVSVSSGLQSTIGPLGLQADTLRNVKLTHELRVQHVSPELGYFGPGSVKVTFNAPIDLSTAADFIRVQPHVESSVESYYSYRSGHECRILGEFRAGESYTVTFCKGLKSATGISLGTDITRTVYFSDAKPSLEFTARGNYMSPKGNMLIPLRLINIKHCKATIKRIYANNLVQLAARQAGRYDRFYGTPHQGISHIIGELEIPLDSERNEIVERKLNLRPFLEGKSGAFHIEIRGDGGVKSSHYVVVSDTGLTVKRSEQDVLVWANSIRTLAPLPNAIVNLFSLENQLLMTCETDAHGVARFDLQNRVEGGLFLVTVEKGDDLTFLRLDSSRVTLRGGIGSRPYLDNGYEAYLFTDRGIYRPGETAHLKAVVRGKEVSCPTAFPIKLNVYRPDGKIDRAFNAMLGDYGTAEFNIPWPDFVPTGKYKLEITLPGAPKVLGRTIVSVEEFVPPQIRARIKTSTERVVADQEFDLEIFSEHLFGRPAAGLPASVRVDFMPHPFSSSQWEGYAFGDSQRQFRTVQKSLGKKHLSVSGKAVFQTKTPSKWRPPAAIKAFIAATVTEMSGRSVTVYGSRLIDVYPFYIGINRPNTSIRVGKTHVFEIATVCPDGTSDIAVRRLKMSIDKLSWISVLKQKDGHYRYCSEQQAVPVAKREVRLKNGVASIEFTPACSGQYRLCIYDPVSESSSSLDFYAGTSGQAWTSRSMEAPDVVELELDKEKYLVGDVATLVIRSPFPGKALLAVESGHILSHQVLEMTNNTAEVKLPIKREYSPNVYCSVSVIRPALPEKTWGQHRAAGLVPLVVDAPSRKLHVKMELPAEIRPGKKLEVPIRVTGVDEKGHKSEVVLAAVDEGICMLTAFRSPDPYDYFFAPRLPGIALHDLYAQLMPEVIDNITGTPSEPGGGMLVGMMKRLNPIKARRFKPVALWSSTVITDDDGKANVVFDVPEFTGQLRIMAVALDDLRFGAADQQVCVKRPLIVQSSLPRFLAPSDSFTMPVRIFNETGKDGQAQVVVSCSGPLVCEQAKVSVTNSLSLPAGALTNVNFRLRALSAPGKATCRLRVSMDSEHFEEEIEIAVRPPASLTTFSGSGVVAPDKDAKLLIPTRWMENTGNTEIWLSSMPGVKLGGSIDYLIRYPYGCLEQTTSKSLPLLYLADLVEQTYPGWLDRDGITDFVRAGIHRVLSMQRNDGSFGLWPGSGTYVWGSVYATHFLVEANGAGYDVPRDRIEDALKYLETFTSKRLASGSQGAGSDLYNRSYACLVLALAQRPQHGSVARLIEQKTHLDHGAKVNLAAALVATGKRRDALAFLGNLGVNPVTLQLREIGGSLRSNVRNDAVLLSTFLKVNPQHKLVPALAKRLESAQTNGRWYTTQENAMALMALGKYCNALASSQESISGRVSWDQGGKSSEFANETEFHVVMKHPKDEAASIHNQGDGAIYYYWKSEGVPADGHVKEVDQGIEVRRLLLDMDGNPIDSPDLKQGDLFVMKTTVEAPRNLDNIVIEDLLPAGMEIENANLKTSQTVSWIRNKQNLPLSHTDIRDDRMIAFTGSFSGERSYYYALRAVTVGEFVLPAISASCMYDPDTKSIHGRGRIRIIKSGSTR